MRIYVSLLIFLLTACAFAGGKQEFVKLKAKVPSSVKDSVKPGEKPAKIDDFGPINHAYPGETKQFVLADTTKYFALRWQSLTPAIATMLDEQGGIAEFHQAGSAVFRIDVFHKEKELPTVVFAIIESKHTDLILEALVPDAMLVGGKASFAPGLTRPVEEATKRVLVARSVNISIKDDALLQLSDDGGLSWKSIAKVQPGTPVQLKGLAAGTTAITVQSAGLTTTRSIRIIKPKVALKSNSDEYLQDRPVTVTAKVVDEAGRDIPQFTFTTTLAAEGVDLKQTGQNQLTFTPRKQGKVKVTATAVEEIGATKGAPAETGTLEFQVKPIPESLVVNSVRKQILNGDKIKVDLAVLDPQGEIISRADRGQLKVALVRLDGAGSEGGVRLISTDKDDFLKFDRQDTNGEYKLVFQLVSGASTVTTEVTDVEFVDDVEVVARLINDRGPSDLFGPQVFREFHVYELTASNNRGLAEDPEMAKASTVHLYGATLRLPALIHNPKGVKPSNVPEFSGVVEGNFRESDENTIAEFARGRGQEVRLYLSPYYSERFEKVKDAVAYRDPVNVLQRFVENVVKVAKFLQLAYPGANSQPFQTEADITRLDQAKTVTDFIFNEYKNELSKKGKVTSSEMLREITKVPKDQPTVVYFLVRKDAWKQINGQTGLNVTMFPVGTVRVSYAVVSETNTTQAAAGGAAGDLP